jgi:Zn-dependent protease with chaperone function
MSPRLRRLLLSGLVLAATVGLTAQTKVEPPKNRYTIEQDVQMGREAAAEVRREYPIIDDPAIDAYLDTLGKRLVAVAPPELNKPQFQYSFTPVNLTEINAFALPGGPMFVNRGMVTAATTEGEVVGVMAHELAHVLLRHGTANATKAQGFQLGALAGVIAGAVVGGGWGEAISQGSQLGLGTWLLKYSRDYEKQADLLGAQIMARAGYDPRDLARMFETIGRQSKGTPPQWLSSHPNPGNRSQYIAQEAALLTIATAADTSGFAPAKARFEALPPPRGTTAGGRPSSAENVSVGTVGRPVPSPARTWRTMRGGRLFEVDIPSNWTAVSSNNSIKYVPQNAYGPLRGVTVQTHGVEFGTLRASSRDLMRATDDFVSMLMRGNTDMRIAGRSASMRMSGHDALATPLDNQSPLGGTEQVQVFTALLSDGSLFYFLTVAPTAEARAYDPIFERIGQSLRLFDR